MPNRMVTLTWPMTSRDPEKSNNHDPNRRGEKGKRRGKGLSPQKNFWRRHCIAHVTTNYTKKKLKQKKTRKNLCKSSPSQITWKQKQFRPKDGLYRYVWSDGMWTTYIQHCRSKYIERSGYCESVESTVIIYTDWENALWLWGMV